jgi:alpha-L-rhamnosidase
LPAARRATVGDWLNGDTLRLDGWPRRGANVPFDVYATAFFARSTALLARMAEVLGQRAEAERYANLAAGIRRAFVGAFVSTDGTVAGDTQAGYALALELGLVPPDLAEAAATRMVAAVERYGAHLSTGFMTTVPLMLQLARFGYLEQAYGLLLQTSIPSWGYMIEHGATTIWERWDGYVEGRGFQDARMNSLCHYSIGAVGEWVWRIVAGLEPHESHPGWQRFTVQPRPGGGLTWARASHESIRGTIRSEWELGDGTLSMRVSVPPGARAIVRVPSAGAVREGGRPVAGVAGIARVESRQGESAYEVGSGDYELSAPL